MTQGVWLTIDDGPSPRFRDLVDFLAMRDIPCVFFNRGDCMAERPDDVIYGIERGFIMANHAYSHQRFSGLSLDQAKEEVLKTEEVLEDIYARSGVARPGKYFRFPYLDRGMGAALCEEVPAAYQDDHNALMGQGLGHIPAAPSAEQIDHKRAIQEFLIAEGFQIFPFNDRLPDWYAQTEMAQAVDWLSTYSSSDWALTARHIGRHGYHSVEDLYAKADRLSKDDSPHSSVFHDQAEIHDMTCAVIDHLLKRDFKFLDFQTQT